jgi:hypothetical protein
MKTDAIRLKDPPWSGLFRNIDLTSEPEAEPVAEPVAAQARPPQPRSSRMGCDDELMVRLQIMPCFSSAYNCFRQFFCHLTTHFFVHSEARTPPMNRFFFHTSRFFIFSFSFYRKADGSPGHQEILSVFDQAHILLKSAKMRAR